MGDVISQRSELITLQLMLRGVKLHIQCDWHLFFCTDFTRSVPLGSQSRTSLSRRDLASPDTTILAQKNPSSFLEGFVQLEQKETT